MSVQPTDKRRRLKPEAELCLLLARNEPTDRDFRRARDIIEQGDIQWRSFLGLVYIHQVYPLVARNLERVGGPVPRDVLLDLKSACMVNTSRVKRAETELDLLVRLLADNGVYAYSYKGPRLGQFLFGDPAMRHSEDIDLIVAPRDWERARQVLEEAGYAAVMSLEGLKRDSWHKATTFMRKGYPNGIPVELHWDFAPRYFDFDTSSLVADVLLEAAANEDAISRERLLVLLAIHASKHEVFVLKWLSDVDRLVQMGLDWDEVALLAKKYRAERATKAMVSLLQAMYGEPATLPPIKKRTTLYVWDIPQVFPSPAFWVTGVASLFVSDRLAVRMTWFLRKVGRIIVDPMPEDYTLPELPRMLKWAYPFLRVHHKVKKLRTLQVAAK